MDASKNENPVNQPTTKWLKDYQPSNFLISQVNLKVDLHENETRVRNIMTIAPNPDVQGSKTLTLDGVELVLDEILVNGERLSKAQYQVDEKSLRIEDFDHFLIDGEAQVSITTRIYPEKNTSLSGLYKSGKNFCTQCEAEGFRKITYFIDRPDIMAIYTVTVTADAALYPVLLSNGNYVETLNLNDGRHGAIWHDPHPKPSYLFALVAGDLADIRDTFTTMSGRQVELIIYSEAHNIIHCDYALASLKRSMEWDEKVYGREYDLDLYMIVAIDDFNAGAMENKGLNIFNTKYVLASPETATDSDYIGVESVIAHEYFHNWSGNRVTCRDWFQLSLKEGFTVFRDQCFTADLHSEGVKRIEDVNILRSHQFKEDAGPMAHPIRPASYQEINNFYTVTVYNKGAEVVRMIRSLVGNEGFRKGSDLYFERHDNNAVTCEDFVAAMEDANKVDLTQFKRWYNQAGTPRVKVEETFDVNTGTLKVTLHQSCRPTPGQEEKQPFVIPLEFALFDANGNKLQNNEHGSVFVLKEPTQSFTFQNVEAGVRLSILRNFSAPVYIDRNIDSDYLSFLARFDDNEFNRWDAIQTLYTQAIFKIMDVLPEDINDASLEAQPLKYQQLLDTAQLDAFCQAIHPLFNAILNDYDSNGQFLDALLQPPTYNFLAEQMDKIHPLKLFYARSLFIRHMAASHYELMLQRYLAMQQAELGVEYQIDDDSISRRALKNRLLAYISTLDNADTHALCEQQLLNADNLTDRMAALSAVVNSSHENRDVLLSRFYEQWKDYSLVMDKWLAIQATSRHAGSVEQVRLLTEHPVFNAKNPNKVYSLIRGFAGNPLHFHASGGQGYEFIADWIIRLNSLNPQVASRITSAFNDWRRFEPLYQEKMFNALKRVQAEHGLSDNVAEIVNKALA